MRRFLSTSFILLALIVGTVSVAPAAHAVGRSCSADNDCEIGEACVSNVCQTSTAALNASTAANTANGLTATGGLTKEQYAAAQAAANTPTDLKETKDEAYNGIMQKILTLFAWLVGVAAITLDNAVYYTVVNMGTYVHNLAAVGVTWRILRDLGNIMLIFGFLAVGITTIMNVDWYGGGKKMLPMMFVAAIFLNFSLFISEAIIDTGNLFATQFYTQINGGTLAGAKNFDRVSVQNDGIANKLMGQLGFANIYGQTLNNTKLLEGNSPWLIGFMGIILFLVTAFVMFSLAFVLITRFVVLIFLIILAPIGFAGLAVPQLRARAGQWWDKLFEQTITAPVLLLLLYVALAVITDAKFLMGSSTDWTGIFTNTDITGFGSMLLSFLVAMGLLLLVVVQSKNLSAVGAAGASKLAGKLTGALSFGAISLAGRGTLGTAGYMLNSKRMQARAAGGGLEGFGAKVASFAGRNLEKRTFDVRNIPGVRTAGSAFGGIPGLGKAGFEGVFAGGATAVTAAGAIDKTREAYKTYVPFSGEWWRAQQNEYEKASSEQDRKAALVAAQMPPGVAGTPEQKKASKDAQDELKKMSVDELAQLKDIRKGTDRLVHNLSPEKFSELMKSDKLIPSEKSELKKSWDRQFVDANSAAIAIGRLGTEEVAALGGGVLTKPTVIDALGATEFDAVMRKGTLNKQQRDDISAHIKSAVPGSARKAILDDYFAAANDPGGRRAKYWGVNPTGGGAAQGGAAGGGTPPPPGYQQNPGGVILTPNNPGGGPRP